MKWKQIIKEYLTFSRKDRIAVLTLAFLLIFVAFVPKIFSRKSPVNQTGAADTAWITEIRKLEIKRPETDGDKTFREHEPTENSVQYDHSKDSYFTNPKAELFYFDPNTIGPEGWKKLGLRDKTIKTIQNYLAKGGHFYNPEDLSRIYGLFEDEYARLEPYIRIEKKEKEVASFTKYEPSSISTAKAERYKAIDINTADTSAYIALPGIGSKLAARIVNFRDKLGGFYSINQVGETFGLPDSTFQKIKQYLKLENDLVKKININTASVDELKAHPYIKYSLANPIVAYRNEHGLFSKIEDLKKVMAITEDVYTKIAPYLSAQ
ncbi:MAG TPA: helix-hairpin-helix domain-containing protein [Chitinophagaceae bacterium]